MEAKVLDYRFPSVKFTSCCQIVGFGWQILIPNACPACLLCTFSATFKRNRISMIPTQDGKVKLIADDN